MLCQIQLFQFDLFSVVTRHTGGGQNSEKSRFLQVKNSFLGIKGLGLGFRVRFHKKNIL